MRAVSGARGITALGLVLMSSQIASPADNRQSERSRFVKHTLGPVAVGRSAAGAAIEQGFNTPSEWGQGAEGFGKRFASVFGHHILKKGIEYPIAKLLHEQYGYRPSDKTGTKARLAYALEGVVITRKTTTGKRTVNGAELSSSIGSGLLSRLWQPASTPTVASGFGSAGTTLAVDAGMNVVREFWPEIRHPHTHAQVRAALLAKQKAKSGRRHEKSQSRTKMQRLLIMSAAQIRRARFPDYRFPKSDERDPGEKR